MLFSSLVFLWIFLPLVLIGSRLLPKIAQNALLLCASLLFYAWGEPIYIILMLVSITANWLFGLLIARAAARNSQSSGGQKQPAVLSKKLWLVLALVVNLGLLGFYKYTGFALNTVNSLFGTSFAASIIMPIGISFYTFQALSYILDLYWGTISVQKSWAKLALYISFFPQLIAGPIVQYGDIEAQLKNRTQTLEKASYGLKRFLYGLAKKVLLSNSFAVLANQVFGLDAQHLSTPAAWVGCLAYTLQIYYDFSGYSDMAIGLGAMFGFDFKENFNYPYISGSCTEFWRRWHMSLSGWFKQYLYIPLGGNRRGAARTYVNLAIVFFCTGLWHGANWQFVIWGLFHGALLIIERIGLKRLWAKLPALGHVFTLFCVMVGWAIFRAPGLRAGAGFIKTMLLPTMGSGAFPVTRLIDTRMLVILLIGVLLCGPIQALVPKLRKILYEKSHLYPVQAATQLVLYFLCVMQLVAGTYNPFIYFRF